MQTMDHNFELQVTCFLKGTNTHMRTQQYRINAYLDNVEHTNPFKYIDLECIVNSQFGLVNPEQK
jgi:hypothetical protein